MKTTPQNYYPQINHACDILDTVPHPKVQMVIQFVRICNNMQSTPRQIAAALLIVASHFL